MSPKVHHDLRKVSKAPDGAPFVLLTAELMCSPAWRYKSVNVGRLIEFLMIEHLNHAGRENGHLFATYDQLVAFGISRRLIAKTIDQAERLRLIEVHRFPRKTFTEAYPLRFRLTFLPDKMVNDGRVYYGEATHDWCRVTEERAMKITGRKKRVSMFRSGTQPVPQTTQIGARSGTLDGSKIAENCDSSRVPEVERLFRSPCTGPGGHQSEMEKST